MDHNLPSDSDSHDRRRIAACVAALYGIFAVIVAISALFLVWGYPLVAGLLTAGGGIALAMVWGFRYQQIRCWCTGHPQQRP